MPETHQHKRLVEIMVEFVRNTYLNGDTTRLLVDSAVSRDSGRPPIIGGFRPDLFAHQPGSSAVILGEAKSIQDFENLHTLAQLTSFMCYCNKSPESIFVLAVPWIFQRNAESLVQMLKIRHGMKSVKTIVLEQLPA